MELSIQKAREQCSGPAACNAARSDSHLTLGDKLIVEVRPEGIMLVPARPKY